MEPAAIITTILSVLNTVVKIAPTVVQAEASLEPVAVAIYNNLVNGAAITQVQLDALEAQVDSLAAQIQVPLPADTDGTTET